MLPNDAKVGDVVLHLYGQYMTIEKLNGPDNQYVHTAWFDPVNTLKRAVFGRAEFHSIPQAEDASIGVVRAPSHER